MGYPVEHGSLALRVMYRGFRIVRGIFTAIATGGMTVMTLGHSWFKAPFDVEYHEVPMPLHGLPASFDGFRIAHLTDLHTGDTTPIWFVEQVVARVNDIGCDLVVITGDLVTNRRKWVERLCKALAPLNAPVIVTLGNHDHAIHQEADLADVLTARLTETGFTVLRNRAMPIEHADGRLWLVGLEDLWTGLISPSQAFAAVAAHEPAIALSHNPDTAGLCDVYGAQWTLSGHTHGGQIDLPVVQRLALPMRFRDLDRGLFRFPQSRLYVSRGVGFYRRVRFLCRPEVPFFVLNRELSDSVI